MSRRRNANPGRGSVSLKYNAVFVSVKTLAANWECSRTTVSRILEEAGISAYYLGSGRNGSKRYLKADVDQFLQSVPQAEPIGPVRGMAKAGARTSTKLRGQETE